MCCDWATTSVKSASDTLFAVPWFQKEHVHEPEQSIAATRTQKLVGYLGFGAAMRHECDGGRHLRHAAEHSAR
jgi:hypothetical protein